MSKPNMYCGECPYWLAFGEPETTDKQNEAILAHCKECNFDPEAKELLNEAKDALLYMLILHKAQDPRYNQEKIIPALYMLQSEPDKWTPERADEVFKKIFDYLVQEEDNGT
jgi:hypothetical protein